MVNFSFENKYSPDFGLILSDTGLTSGRSHNITLSCSTILKLVSV